MNVAVLEPASPLEPESGACDGERQVTFGQSEWIDPEGDDWLTSIYRFLTHDSASAGGAASSAALSDLEHWFG